MSVAIVHPGLLALWAKTGHPYHHLAGHLLDTAAVTFAVLQREPVTTRRMYATALGLDEEAALRLLAAIAGAHDLGKASPVFQAQWEEGRARAQAAGFLFTTRKSAGSEWVAHGVLTEAFFRRLLQERGFAPRLARSIARAVAAHHGFLATKSELVLTQDPDVVGTGYWEVARRELIELLFRTLHVQGPPSTVTLDDATSVAIMALASFSDWVASDPSFFQWGRKIEDPCEYWQEALRLADRALTAIGWRPRTPLLDEHVRFDRIFTFPPNPLQRAIAQAVTGLAQPTLLLIETPMGTGKTEAALYAHTELQQVLGHRGLYVALPTMATGNGMFARLKDFLQRMGPRATPFDLQLQHGTAFLNPQYRAIQPYEVGDVQRDPEAAVVARTWFSARKRAMLSEYGVGTVDQALLGVLRVRHHFVRLWGLANRTVVLDEVHAYDAYTSGLVETLLRWLKTLGSSAIVMSATLPRSRRNAILKAYAVEPPHEDVPYPRITIAQGTEARSLQVLGLPSRAMAVGSAPRDLRELAPRLLDEVRDGGCLACIVNTVDRAQRLYQALGPGEAIEDQGIRLGKQVAGIPVYLLHARYPAAERQKREEFLIRCFGKEGYATGTRPHRAVLVATQVVEQSLDLDFDAMVTDLAPMDLVLQRAGRLHRFDLAALSKYLGRAMGWHRPAAHASPRLWVAGLAEAPPDLEAEHWDKVYAPYVLLMSWWALRRAQIVRIPEDLEALVEQVYDAPIPEDLPPDMAAWFEEARSLCERQQSDQRAWAHHSAISNPSELLADVPTDILALSDLDDDEETPVSQTPLTRYGEPSVMVIPLHRVGNRLALDAAGVSPAQTDEVPENEQALRLFLRSVRLGRPEVYRALVKTQPPAGWARHPLLRRMRVLELLDGRARIGRTVVRLDPELGVVYEP